MDFKLIVTIGPSILSKIDKLQEIHHAGPCIFRLNGAHCSPQQLKIYAAIVRAVIPDAALMIDLPGNKIRTAGFTEKIRFDKNEAITLPGSSFNYEPFPGLLKKNDVILANDSTLRFTVLESSPERVTLRAEQKGELAGGKGMHVKGIGGALPFLFQADRDLITAAAEMGLPYVSLSYVRTADDVKGVKKLLADRQYAPNIIAKIETAAALENLDAILDEVDHANIDRGDLSTDVGILKLAECQEAVIKRALAKRKRIFLATQFLKNMEIHPVPLIPEVIDLTNSIAKNISGIQLSEETAVGVYPLECIRLIWDVYRNVRRST